MPSDGLAGVIFDLDGTLTDSWPVALSAFRTAVAAYSAEQWSDAALMALAGPAEEGILQRLLPDRWEQCFERYIEEYRNGHDRCTAPFPGVAALLEWLRERRLPLALVTGKTRRAASITLEQVAIAGYFDIVETGSPSGDVKAAALGRVVARWALPPHRVAYVGDAAADMVAANAVGLVALGAAWAATAKPPALVAAGAAMVFTSAGDLLAWIRQPVG